ncbi:MAG: matrixin family metalloprotease [Bacillota bacterium]
MKKFVLITLIVFIISLTFGGFANAYSLLTYHWADNGTYSYTVNSNFSSASVNAFSVAAYQYNTLNPKHVTFSNGGTNTLTNSSYDGVNEIVKGNYGSQFLMATDSWPDWDNYYPNPPWHINYEADIRVNTYYAWSTAADTPSGYYSTRSAMTHEMGHVCGIDHSTHTDAVMYATFADGEDRNYLTQDDLDGYYAIRWN